MRILMTRLEQTSPSSKQEWTGYIVLVTVSERLLEAAPPKRPTHAYPESMLGIERVSMSTIFVLIWKLVLRSIQRVASVHLDDTR